MAAVPLSSLLIFTSQLSSMIRSQLPLVDVLESLTQETPHGVLRNTMDAVVEDVRHGVDFGDALAEFPDVFDQIYVNIIRAGMMSGRLGDSIEHIAIYLKKINESRDKIRSALTYPIFMFASFIFVLNGMIFFILPRFKEMFASFGSKLPIITQWLMTFADWWRQNWHLVMLTIGVMVFSFIFWIATSEGRYLWDKYKLRILVFGNLIRLAALSRFLRTFSVQLQNEVELLPSLKLAAGTVSNVYIEDLIYSIIFDIERGKGIADSFREYEVFSGIVLQMIAAGEEAGTLDILLLSAADYFERLLDNELERWTALINPILTIIVGLAVAGMMVAVFLPIFDMGKAVGHGR
ncbi:putative Type IV pilus assembly protein PilC [Gammaproteobacteria bacterium]